MHLWLQVEKGELDLMDGIEEVLAEVLQIPASTISDNLSMKDTDAWDSLKHMELIVSLEQRFKIELSFDDIIAMQSVSDIKRVLRERSAAS